MTRCQFVSLLLVAAVFSFLGGMFANSGLPWARAETVLPSLKVQELKVLDKDGTVRASLGVNSSGDTTLFLFGPSKGGGHGARASALSSGCLLIDDGQGTKASLLASGLGLTNKRGDEASLLGSGLKISGRDSAYASVLGGGLIINDGRGAEASLVGVSLMFEDSDGDIRSVVTQ